MGYCFDENAPRRGTACYKWDELGKIFGNPEALPFWVADTDYPTAPEVVSALREAVGRAAFGYTYPDDGYLESVCGWVSSRHGWNIEKEWIVPSTGVVSGLSNIIRCFTEPGDGIVVQSPVYDPFYHTVERSGRRLIKNWLKGDNVSGYTMDFDDLERCLSGAKMMVLCSPHNPVGRVWTERELAKVAELCTRSGVMLVSDEIHWDILIDGAKHVSLGAAAKQGNIAVLTAPSKTFNLAGLQTSNIIIPDAAMRETYKDWLEERFIEGPNLLGMTACRAAYENGAAWCDEQNAYLTGSARLVEKYFGERFPQVTIARLEGTYLMWMDMRAFGLTSRELCEKFAGAGAALNDGFRYGGEPYDGYVRLNIACPRPQLEKGLEIIGSALGDRE